MAKSQVKFSLHFWQGLAHLPSEVPLVWYAQQDAFQILLCKDMVYRDAEPNQTRAQKTKIEKRALPKS
jgi:hypothetical protein